MISPHRPRALIFDLDGTLIDSAPDLHRALLHLLAEDGLPRIALDDVRSMVGDGSAMLVTRAYARAGRTIGADLPSRLERFLDLYENGVADLTRPYPGVRETLRLLSDAGHRMGICTNKPDGPARAIIEALDLGGHFGAIVGGDIGASRKPDPRHVQAVLAALDATPENAVLIGDGTNDLLAGAAAGVPVILARYGYGLRGDPPPAQAIIDTFSEIPDVLQRIDGSA